MGNFGFLPQTQETSQLGKGINKKTSVAEQSPSYQLNALQERVNDLETATGYAS